jgi:type I restriction enzyme S subunit
MSGGLAKTCDCVPLRDICEQINYGYTAGAKQEPIGPKFLRITDIVDELIDWESVPYCKISDREFAKYELQQGDIVIARTGATSGYAKMIKKHPKAVFASYLVRLRIKEEHDWRYVGLVVESADFKRYIKSVIGGAAQPQANAQVLTSFPIPLPPLPTQHKIAVILSAYDNLIENNTRRIKILEEMAQIIYHEWFVNFRFPGHERLKMVESELGMIPEGWELKGYSELLKSFHGGDWGEEEPTEKELRRVAVIRGTDFDDVRLGNNLRVPIRYIAESSLVKRRLQEGDVIVENSVNASSRCVGKSLLITRGILDRIGMDTIAASFCKVFRPIRPDLGVLIHAHLKYLYEEGKMAFYQHVATNGIGNLQAKRFVESESLPVPTDRTLLISMLSTLSDVVSSNYADRNANLRRTHDLLLPRLISGEIDVENLNVDTEALGDG